MSHWRPALIDSYPSSCSQHSQIVLREAFPDIATLVLVTACLFGALCLSPQGQGLCLSALSHALPSTVPAA
jgi:hypothetical protein